MAEVTIETTGTSLIPRIFERATPVGLRFHGLRISSFGGNGRDVRVFTSGTSVPADSPPGQSSLGGSGNEPAEWLPQAIAALNQADAEAADEGLAAPSALAKTNARSLIEALARSEVLVPTIYPTEDGEVAILFQIQGKGSVLILCESKGQAVCFSTFDSRNRRTRYSHAEDLPDEFVKSQLRALEGLST